MKLVIRLFTCFLFFANTLYSQVTESPEFKTRSQEMLGIVDGTVYYFDFIVYKKGYKITFYKYDKETLADKGQDELIIPPVDGIKAWGPQAVTAKVIDDKFYFFYTFSGKNRVMPIYLTVCDAHLINPYHMKVSQLVMNADWNNVNYGISFSPQNKTALIVVKNFCDRLKWQINEDNSSTLKAKTICEDVDLTFLNLKSSAIGATKKLPVEMHELRLQTRQHQVDDDGNVICIASITDPKANRNVIEATSTACLKKNEETLTIHELNLGDTKKVGSYLKMLNNGDAVYIGTLDSKFIFRSIPADKTQREIETEFSNKTFVGDKKQISDLYDILECANGYYLAMNNFSGYFGVAFVTKKGELSWYKATPSIRKAFTDLSAANAVPYTFCYQNKLYMLFLENSASQQNTSNSGAATETEQKTFDLSLVSIDENGTTQKEVISKAIPSPINLDDMLFSDKGFVIVTLKQNNTSKIKKIYLR